MTKLERELLDTLAKVVRGLLQVNMRLDPTAAHLAQAAYDEIGRLELAVAAERADRKS